MSDNGYGESESTKGGTPYTLTATMHSPHRFRSLRTVVGALSLLQVCSLGLHPSAVHADMQSGRLIIKQIDWAGTASNPADQWVEIYNPTEQVVDLAQDPYSLSIGGTTVATLSTGALTPMQSLIISRLNPSDPSAHSALNASLHTQVDANLVLPTANGQYTLTDAKKSSVDVANLSKGAPFAGSLTASQQRVIDAKGQYLPGDQSAAWMSGQAIGRNVAAGSQQYSAPAESNPTVVAQPTAPIVVTAQTDRPTVRASFPAAYGIVNFINVLTGETVQGVGDTVSGYQPAIPLKPGTYRVSIASATAPDGDRSAPVTVPVPTTVSTSVPTIPQNGPVQMPVLDAFSSVTNKPTITLTGSVQPGTVSVLATANNTTVSQALNGMTTFSLTLPLLANGSTAIQLTALATDGSKSQPLTVQIIQSTVAPRLPAADHVAVLSSASGTADSVSGQPGAVTSNAKVSLYADQALTMLIAQTAAAQDGSFSSISLGDNRYATAYLVQTDQTGNTSSALLVTNPIPVADQNVNLLLQLQDISASSASLQLLPMNGVSRYLLKYRTATGQYGTPISVCADASLSCSLTKHLMGLSPATDYVVAVAAVNTQGQMSNYSEAAFRTVGLPPVTVSTASVQAVPVAVVMPTPTYVPRTAPVPVAQVAAPTTPAPSPTAIASASPSPTENGDVKSATTARNWTPWIVLGVLIGLAILATAGYFYWFGGEAGAAMDAAATKPKPVSKEDPTVNKSDTKRW